MKTNLKTFPKVDTESLVGYQWDVVKWRKDFEASLRSLIKDCEDWKKECPLEDVPKYEWEIEVLKEVLGDG